MIKKTRHSSPFQLLFSPEEPISVKSFSRFSGSFEPIFDPNSGDNIRMFDITPRIWIENRRKILLEIGSKMKRA